MEQTRELQQMLIKRRAMTSAASTASSASRPAIAVKAVQVKLGMPADSYPTPELIARLRGAQ